MLQDSGDRGEARAHVAHKWRVASGGSLGRTHNHRNLRASTHTWAGLEGKESWRLSQGRANDSDGRRHGGNCAAATHREAMARHARTCACGHECP